MRRFFAVNINYWIRVIHLKSFDIYLTLWIEFYFRYFFRYCLTLLLCQYRRFILTVRFQGCTSYLKRETLFLIDLLTLAWRAQCRELWLFFLLSWLFIAALAKASFPSWLDLFEPSDSMFKWVMALFDRVRELDDVDKLSEFNWDCFEFLHLTIGLE